MHHKKDWWPTWHQNKSEKLTAVRAREQISLENSPSSLNSTFATIFNKVHLFVYEVILCVNYWKIMSECSKELLLFYYYILNFFLNFFCHLVVSTHLKVCINKFNSKLGHNSPVNFPVNGHPNVFIFFIFFV